MKKLCLCIFLVAMQYAAAGAIDGKVVKLEAHANNWGSYRISDTGLLSIYIDGLKASCPKGDAIRIIISHDHPLYDTTVSMLLAAKLSDRKVYIDYLDSCTYRPDGVDFGFISFRH